MSKEHMLKEIEAVLIVREECLNNNFAIIKVRLDDEVNCKAAIMKNESTESFICDFNLETKTFSNFEKKDGVLDAVNSLEKK